MDKSKRNKMAKNTLLFVIIGITIGFCVYNSIKLRELTRDDFACAHIQGLSTDKDSFCIQDPDVVENFSNTIYDDDQNQIKRNYENDTTRILPEAFKNANLQKTVRSEISDRDTEIPGDPTSYPQFVSAGVSLNGKVPH